jgi:hypothetical protein
MINRQIQTTIALLHEPEDLYFGSRAISVA